jgi:inner membrane protein
VVQGWAGRHQLGVVKMLVPTHHWDYDERTKKRELNDSSLKLDPTTVKVEMKDKMDIRHRGIFEVPIYKGDLKVSGEFAIPKDLGRPKDVVTPGEQTILFEMKQAWAISDFTFTLDGEKQQLKRTSEGLLLKLKEKTFQPGDHLNFELIAKLNGYGGMDIQSSAEELEVFIDSSWPSLSFKGQHPIDQNASKNGWTAHWKLLQPASDQIITIDYFEPINIYSQSARALKYGFLITLLCLSVLFLYETLSRFQIHPMQYLLMTLPLSVYYVLLIALAEHIGFSAAYATASFAVIALIYVYFAGIGASRKQALGLAGILSLVYSLILSMLASEDYALLIGAITLFICLAAFMLLTRKLNWSKGAPAGQLVNG